MKTWFADHTNPDNLRGSASDALVGADVFIGLSGPGVITVDDLGKMNREPIVFAMANPTPEIMPEEAARYVRVMATGRSDYPNQINNSCGFPGIFRGLFDVRARRVNDEMKLAAAHALARYRLRQRAVRRVHHPVDVRLARGAGGRLRRGRRRRAHRSGPPQARVARTNRERSTPAAGGGRGGGRGEWYPRPPPTPYRSPAEAFPSRPLHRRHAGQEGVERTHPPGPRRVPRRSPCVRGRE